MTWLSIYIDDGVDWISLLLCGMHLEDDCCCIGNINVEVVDVQVWFIVDGDALCVFVRVSINWECIRVDIARKLVF